MSILCGIGLGIILWNNELVCWCSVLLMIWVLKLIKISDGYCCVSCRVSVMLLIFGRLKFISVVVNGLLFCSVFKVCVVLLIVIICVLLVFSILMVICWVSGLFLINSKCKLLRCIVWLIVFGMGVVVICNGKCK